MPHFFRTTTDTSNDPLFEVLDDDPVLDNLRKRRSGNCQSAQVDLSGSTVVGPEPYHCTAPPANITTIIRRLP